MCRRVIQSTHLQLTFRKQVFADQQIANDKAWADTHLELLGPEDPIPNELSCSGAQLD